MIFHPRLFVLVAAVLMAGVVPAAAQSFPDGPGRAILEAQCSSCHAPDVVRTSRRSADEWHDVVIAMNDLGAKVTEAQLPVLVEYLGKNFSPSSSGSLQLASPTAPATSASDPAAAALSPARTALRENDPAAIAKRLSEAKLSILDGILQAERGNGPAISAKFEIEDGKLMLSVYNAKKGMGLDAEYNVLTELKGNATTATWQPTLEVFEDKAHIARASTQLTVLQMGHLLLSEYVQRAATLQNGTVYSVIPRTKGGKPAIDVLIAGPGGQTSFLTLDVQTGEKLP